MVDLQTKITILKECIGLRNSEYLKQLKRDREEVIQKLVLADKELTARQLQGQAQLLDVQIAQIETSKEELEKALAPRRGRQM